MTNNTHTSTTAAAPLTAMGAALLTAIGRQSFSFFDDGVVAASGIWHDDLTSEAAGLDGQAKTATGVANVIEKLVADGYLLSTDEDGNQWVSLTELGAETAQRLARERVAELKPNSRSRQRKSDEGTGELKGGDVQPLAKTMRGNNGTTKRGKSVTKKTGDPKADAAVSSTAKSFVPKMSPAMTTTKSGEPIVRKTTTKTTSKSKSAAAKTTTTKREPGKFSTKGQHVITNRRSRFSGTVVQLVNVNGTGSQMKPGPKGETYARKCVDHDFAQYAPTRKEAWDGASDPTQWCPKCKRAAAKRAAADAK